MNSALVTFQSNREAHLPYGISTGIPLQERNELDFTAKASAVIGARGVFEDAMTKALMQRSEFPVAEADLMIGTLNWEKGLPLLRGANPSVIKFTMDKETCLLLPEMALLKKDDSSVSWLDTLAPIYRTIGHVGQRPVQRCQEKSLAILYQVEDQTGDVFDFGALARDVQRDLFNDLNVDLYVGSDVASETTKKLHEIFHKHRAVLFLGHHYRGNRDQGGWQLTPRDGLTMSDLSEILRPASQGSYGGNSIPEVVFAGCCSSAWRDPNPDPNLPYRPPLVYPEVFLDNGVECFIGTWMDVVMPGKDYKDERDLMRRLISGFFQRWATQLDGAVFHLYEAKKECGFHPLTSLYQIYTLGAKGIPAPETANPGGAIVSQQPEGALLMGLSAGDRIGDYELVEELWATSYSRTFWAVSARGAHMAQVLVDEWQGLAEMFGKLQDAVRKLQDAELGDGHLVPSRAELAMLSRRGQEQRGLQMLVYDRPAGESARDWSALKSGDFDPQSPGHFQEVLSLGAQIGERLSELHAKKIRHGNLDPNSILFYSRRAHRDGQRQVALKDVWVAQARPGRCTKLHYGAPEEMASREGGEELKTDCWGLGVILFELATGQSPSSGVEAAAPSVRPSIRETLGRGSHQAPEALERVVRECLAPVPALRPSAQTLTRRLALSVMFGGGYVSKFEEEFLKMTGAGQRLFAVWMDDRRALDSTLDGLADAGYRIFIAAEGEGLIDRKTRESRCPWIENQEVARQMGQPSLSLPDDFVAAINADQILLKATELALNQDWKKTPIVVIEGAGWWNSGPPEIQIGVWRLLKRCQSEYHTPIFVVVDHWIPLEVEVGRSFCNMIFPPLSGTDVFERILAFPQSSGLSIPPVDERTAIELAQQLSPCSDRDLTYALRLCSLAYGVVDKRALEIRDAYREQFFRAARGVSYTPLAKLPAANSLGLPEELAGTIEVWSRATLNLLNGETVTAAPRRLMIEGPSGYGKTQLGLLLGQLTERPVVRLDAARCLQGNVGESEQEFRRTLAAIASIPGVVVLLDDVDRFFGAPPAGQGQQATTIARMSGIFEQWMDSISPATTVVLTSVSLAAAPATWQRRIELSLNLAAPHTLDENKPGGVAYRRAVFAAVFRRAGLERLAADHHLMEELAVKTLPTVRPSPLRSPLALASDVGSLRAHTSKLENGAEIENWVQETLLLHARRGDPATPEFWTQKI